RRLTPERELELLRVTAELIGEVGYDGVTMAAVAERAKCSTATLYRQWESKPRLVFSAWKAQGSTRGVDFSKIDTGSLRDDLAAFVRYLVADDPAKELFASVPAAIARDGSLMEILREVLVHPLLKDFAGLFEHAVERGEITAGNPVIALADRIVFGSWFAQDVLHGTPATEEQLVAVVDTVLMPALTAHHRAAG
ncbi:TetR/AcrR family transcriptional regulator, partial [Streptomyces sp. NPDC058953]